MMVQIETDPAWWAIVVSYSMVLGFTLGIGLRDDSWDTISSMVARAELTLHGFAMVTVGMLGCQLYWLRVQIERFTQATRTRTEPWLGDPIASTCIALGALGSTIGALGFGIVSKNLSEDDHIRFAGVAFCSVLLYLFGFLKLSLRKESKVHGSRAAMGWLALAALSLVLLWQDQGYAWEYVLVTALHGGALALTYPNAQPILYQITL